ncbi:lamin tail domain-containing protein [Streptomyces sp. NPDC005476]|uniref:lamin tail domain-containing protein n=1 Tax=Streptomyces sp. NPDC005476 TaxID=3156882 RepID=UPI003456E62C
MSAAVSVSATARRVSAAALAAGALVLAAVLPASAADQARPQHSKVRISAVQHDFPGHGDGSNRSLNRERVQLTNPTRRAVDLDGWTLADEDGHTYAFHHYRLAARSTVRIHTGVGRDTRSDLYQNRRRHVWDSDSDTATLRDDRGRLVDASSWGRGSHHRPGVRR